MRSRRKVTALTGGLLFVGLLLQGGVANAQPEGEGPPKPSIVEFALDVSSGSVTKDAFLETVDIQADSEAARASSTSPVAILKSKRGVYALASTGLLRPDLDTELRAFWAAGDGFVDLSWADVRVDDEPYEIFDERGALVGRTTDPFVRVSATPGTHRFDVRTSVPKAEAEWTAEDKEIHTETGEGPRLGYLWSLNATVPSGDSLSSIESASAELQVSMSSVEYVGIRHRAFLRQEYLDAPPGGCTYTWPNHKYGGDNRGWSAWSGTHRAFVDVRVNFSGSSTWVTGEKGTGITRVYDMNNNLVATDQATANDIAWGVNSLAPGGAGVWADLVANDPFCWVGGIVGYWNAGLSNEISYAIVGEHRDAPEHEIYVYTPAVTIPVHQTISPGLHCLTDVCPWRTIDAWS